MCKHVFVPKTNSGIQSTKANASVEILFALRWNFDCNCLATHCFSRVCIATKQKREQFAKHVFVQKNKRRQTKYKANARVEILFALHWNFDCITLLAQGFLFVYWAYTQKQKTWKMLFCAKNKRRQTKYKAKARVEILIAIALLRIAFRGYA